MRRAGGRRGASADGAGFLLIVLAGAALGCGEGPEPLVVGSKNFTEQDILGELVATWIERTTEIPVQRRLHLGGTFLCHRAITAGEIDLYVEYTGTALAAILERSARGSAEAVATEVHDAYGERFGLVWAAQLGFENTFAMLVRRATADSLGLRTLSDAVPHAAEWTGGFGYEFAEREDGLPGLRRTYGLELAGTRTMDLGLTYRALAQGRVDLVAGNSTDGQIAALDLAWLEDDRGFFPPYDAAPVVRADALARHAGLAAALDRLAGRIDTETMRALNRAVDVDGRAYDEVARGWVDRVLQSEGAGRVDSPARGR